MRYMQMLGIWICHTYHSYIVLFSFREDPKKGITGYPLHPVTLRI